MKGALAYIQALRTPWRTPGGPLLRDSVSPGTQRLPLQRHFQPGLYPTLGDRTSVSFPNITGMCSLVLLPAWLLGHSGTFSDFGTSKRCGTHLLCSFNTPAVTLSRLEISFTSVLVCVTCDHTQPVCVHACTRVCILRLTKL